MNLLHLSTFDTGGAAGAAYRLHRALAAAGHRSKLVVLAQQRPGDGVLSYLTSHPLRRMRKRVRDDLARLVHRHPSDPDYIFRDGNYSPVGSVQQMLGMIPFRPDFIIAHWISDFVTAGQLHRLSRETGAPVIWHLLDMGPLAGGCHYAWDCDGYRQECGRCPALHSRDPHDRSHRCWLFKQRHLGAMDLTVVVASQRLNEQATDASLLRGKRIEKILLGVDPATFAPRAREAAKSELGLPREAVVIFFGSLSRRGRRKGFSYLAEALHILIERHGLEPERVLLVTAGQVTEAGAALTARLPHRHIGYLDGDRALATAYQAADIFVCPSIEDSGPVMINESMMCGTPVVAFDMGVARDLVHTGRTGYRAELKNSGDLARGIKSILDLNEADAQAMSERCRETALALCAPEVQVKAFEQLFKSVRFSGGK